MRKIEVLRYIIAKVHRKLLKSKDELGMKDLGGGGG